MAGRRRKRIVPNGAVEVFELRAALYYEGDGSATVTVITEDADGDTVKPALHEVLGVLEFAKLVFVEKYDREDQEGP